MITITLPSWFIYLVAVLIFFYIFDVMLKVILAVLTIQQHQIDKDIAALAKHMRDTKDDPQ